MSHQLNMIPFKYPSDYDRFKNGLHNFWTPFQVPMGQDKLHYDRFMSPALKRIAITNLANLTTADVEIMDNVALGLGEAMVRLGLADAVETRMLINQQAFQEALHTASYQHVIESLGLTEQEQADFYTLWQTVPSMRDKVEFAWEITEQLMSDSITVEQFLVYAFFYWQLYEGGWFYTGFSVNFAISEFHRFEGTPCMQGTTEQLRYILRDEEQHIAFGGDVIRRIGKPRESTVHNLVSRMLTLEEQYARYLLPEPILGYNWKLHADYLWWIMNQRLRSFEIFPWAKDVTNPFPWRASYELKQEANFFEKHVNEYRTGGGLQWDD